MAEPSAVLAVRAAGGDSAALDDLVARMHPLLHRLARRFEGVAPRDDLEQAGVLGVLAASGGFDHTRGAPFESYAVPFIVGEMAACARAAGSIRLPRHVRDDLRELDQVIERLTARRGGSPTVADLVADTGWDEERVVDTLRARAAGRPISVETLSEAALAAGDRDRRAADARLDLEIRAAGLEPRLRAVLVLRFGSDLTQREIADRLGISQMHVSRLLRRALESING